MPGGYHMKKRILIYAITITLSIIFSVIFKDIGDRGIFLLYVPLLALKDGLTSLSVASGFGNVIAWLILILVSASPLGIGILILKRKMIAYDIVCLIGLSITLGVSYYLMINTEGVPQWLEIIHFFQEAGDIKPLIAYGILNIWFGLCLLYVVVRILIVTKSFGTNYINLLVILMSVVLVILVQSFSTDLFQGEGKQRTLSILSGTLDIIMMIATLTLSECMITMIDYFRQKEYKDKLLHLAKWIKVLTLIIILLSLTKLISINLYQLRYLNELTNASFDFSIDIVSWLFVFFFYGLYHYITDTKDLMEEAELTI
jgi:hypothetical protein